jgi:hypothetical protein
MQNRHFTLDLRNVGPVFHLSWTQARTGLDAIAPASLEQDIMPGDTRLSIP